MPPHVEMQLPQCVMEHDANRQHREEGTKIRDKVIIHDVEIKEIKSSFETVNQLKRSITVGSISIVVSILGSAFILAMNWGALCERVKNLSDRINSMEKRIDSEVYPFREAKLASKLIDIKSEVR